MQYLYLCYYCHSSELSLKCSITIPLLIKGVHYPDDNIAGLNIAQEVLARALPKFLKDKYNSNPFAVARKIRLSRYDWREFDPQNPCPRR